MEVKDLNRSQFVLLLILVCFVVSIATSITTYALLDKAPENIKKPITQVVQKTVERIVEVEGKNQTLSEEDKKLLEDLKSLKPLIDKLATENPNNTTTSGVDTSGTDVVKDGTTKTSDTEKKDTNSPADNKTP